LLECVVKTKSFRPQARRAGLAPIEKLQFVCIGDELFGLPDYYVIDDSPSTSSSREFCKMVQAAHGYGSLKNTQKQDALFLTLTVRTSLFSPSPFQFLLSSWTTEIPSLYSLSIVTLDLVDMSKLGQILLLSVLLLSPSISAFAFGPSPSCPGKARTTQLHADGTGGWGIGNSRNMVPEEFAKGDRRAFEGYNLRDRGEFMRKVKEDSQEMKNQEFDELLGVAKMAGINVKNPSERLDKFGADFLEDEDDLDVSVSWDDSDRSGTIKGSDDSITRLDEDTLGIW
jgi:hypothetical protein